VIDYTKTSVGDILRIVGPGAPGFAELGDLVRVTAANPKSVFVEDRHGEQVEFIFSCGAARLEPTEWMADFPPEETPDAD